MNTEKNRTADIAKGIIDTWGNEQERVDCHVWSPYSIEFIEKLITQALTEYGDQEYRRGSDEAWNAAIEKAAKVLGDSEGNATPKGIRELRRR